MPLCIVSCQSSLQPLWIIFLSNESNKFHLTLLMLWTRAQARDCVVYHLFLRVIGWDVSRCTHGVMWYCEFMWSMVKLEWMSEATLYSQPSLLTCEVTDWTFILGKGLKRTQRGTTIPTSEHPDTALILLSLFRSHRDADCKRLTNIAAELKHKNVTANPLL